MGKHPVLLGLTLIHKHLDREAFSYLASSMIRLKPSLARILAVGCDRDKSIKNGLIEFHSWFVRYQAKDMKEMLLYPGIRDVGLNPESVHRNIKARQNYKATEMPTVVETSARKRMPISVMWSDIWNPWSSQYLTQFKQLRIEVWKSQAFNRVWTRDLVIPGRRFNQLSYEATDVGSWSFVSSNEPVKNGCEIIYGIFHLSNCWFEIN